MPYLTSASKRTRKRKKGELAFYAARWLAFLFCVAFLIWSLFAPASAGTAGRWLNTSLLRMLGAAAYILPIALLYGLLRYFRSSTVMGLASMALSWALVVVSAALILATAAAAFSRPDWGGALGDALARFAGAGFGRFGASLAGLAGLLLGLQLLFDVSWGALFKRLIRLIGDDYRTWMQSRLDLDDLLNAARNRPPEQDGPARMAPIPQQARRDSPVITEPEPAPPADPQGKDSERTEKSDDKKAAPAPRARGAGAEYELPPLNLLERRPSSSSGGRPSDAEIEEAVASLERTLASFEIDARVTGISPGPVITRYEVSPAPGVTVSSIVARSNDIALAMKARGIRLLAPIPGKAAIGIEIPNREPLMVTLREVLESRAFDPDAGPLSFALGLSSDGAPLSADLQAMPHILVAGATNSGKSVMVHSLIASILFRERPDRVKFLLIDPKRIELTLYEGIPHLYDPKTPPDEVKVITQAGEAAAALKALVRVMENRYEKFQAYRVQNIAQFNREAAKRGEDGDFYIVVVIDELADLMVVARDVVEDSIQRLTQMARAVGIHMVIATQRPSVDVLTGVIKANLPSRIALRVASKVDSKVVIDGNGAEALLGKGDALYLSPGRDPARIQGCFISTKEIGSVVDFLKERSRPDYPLLETMISGDGEAALSKYGVEPLEFTQALKLVLERRRVSQDLLKSQFGSSARATNLLSLLEIMGFINKPEGSNRWNIHFEKIEDYLRTHHPQVNLDKPGI